MSNKEKYLKNEHKVRNPEKRSLQHKNHGNTATHSNKSSEREAKHLKTAIRRCGDWTEHVSSSGKHYYFYIKTSTSQWEKPKDWDDSHSVEMKHRKLPSKISASIKPSASVAAAASSRQTDQKTTQNQQTKPMTSSSSGGCHDNNEIDKDFRRSPQRHMAADRDYRSAKMTSSATRDVDLRKEAMMTSSTAAGGKTRGKHVTSSSDRDYRQPMMTSSSGNCSDYDTTTIGSNGQPLLPSNESRDVSGDGVMTSLHIDKPATGEFFDYSNWDGIRPPLKSPSSASDVTTATTSHMKTSNVKNENATWLSSDNSSLMTSTPLNNNATVTSSQSTSGDVIMLNGATENKANCELMTSSGKRVRLSTDPNVTSSIQYREVDIKEEIPATEEVTSSSNSVITVSAFVSGRRFFDSSLIQHLHNWPSLSHEREAHRSSMDSQRISMTSSILDCELLKAKSSVRSLEIARNLQQHRIRKIREHMKDADSLSTSNQHHRFERNGNDVITNTSSSSSSSNHIDVTAHKLKSSEASA